MQYLDNVLLWSLRKSLNRSFASKGTLNGFGDQERDTITFTTSLFFELWSILTKMGLSGDTEGSWCHWFRSHEATAFISSKGKIRTELHEFKGPGCSQMWASRQGRKLPRGTVSWSKCCCLPRVPLPMAAQGTSDSRVLKLSCILKRKIDASELRKRDCT